MTVWNSLTYSYLSCHWFLAHCNPNCPTYTSTSTFVRTLWGSATPPWAPLATPPRAPGGSKQATLGLIQGVVSVKWNARLSILSPLPSLAEGTAQGCGSLGEGTCRGQGQRCCQALRLNVLRQVLQVNAFERVALHAADITGNAIITVEQFTGRHRLPNTIHILRRLAPLKRGACTAPEDVSVLIIRMRHGDKVRSVSKAISEAVTSYSLTTRVTSSSLPLTWPGGPSRRTSRLSPPNCIRGRGIR